MRTFLLATALLATAAPVLSQPANAARHHHGHFMSVQLASGKTLTFHVVPYHGQMMAMIPASAIDASDVFHRK
jgi:hypothetical protein